MIPHRALRIPSTYSQEEVQETKDQISLLHEKLQLEGSKLNAIVRQQIEVDAELHKRREYMERALLKSEKVYGITEVCFYTVL